MGNAESTQKPAAVPDIAAAPAPPPLPAAVASSAIVVESSSSSRNPMPTYVLGLEEARSYLQVRVPSSIFCGGVAGASIGYYVGDMMALYFYTYALGAGFVSTAFYGTTYMLRVARQQDDVFNYAVSGGVNSAWMITGLAGLRKGVLGGLFGVAAGAAYKVGGDLFFDMSRTAWLQHRRFTLENSTERRLVINKPKFHPNDSQAHRYGKGEERHGSIIPKVNPHTYIHSMQCIYNIHARNTRYTIQTHTKHNTHTHTHKHTHTGSIAKRDGRAAKQARSS